MTTFGAGELLDRLSLRKVVLLAGAPAVLVGVVVLVLIGTSGLGSRGLLVALGVGLVLMVQGVTLLAVLLLLRERRRDRAATVELTADLLRRSAAQGQRLERVAARSRAQGKRLRTASRAVDDAAAGIRDVRAAVEHARADVARRAELLQLDTHRQVQALLTLERIVQVRSAVPPMGGWAASPDLVVLCVQSLLEERPATVVECGSGVSTLFLALAVAQHELPTRIVTLEHDADYARTTRQLLERHGVQDHVDLRLAPLEPTSVSGHETRWYAESALADVSGIGLLLVDGPPGDTGHHARYPALPLLRDRLADHCVVLMDDVNRDEDREVAERWAAESPDFELEVVRDYQKHVGILRR